jgi:hypothetical protein
MSPGVRTGPSGGAAREHRVTTIHGTACQAEFTKPQKLDQVVYRGWGLEVHSQNQLVWVHAPLVAAAEAAGVLEAPQLPGDTLTGITIHFAVDSNDIVGVQHLHLWDGSDRFFQWDNEQPLPAPLKLAVGADGRGTISWNGSHTFTISVGASIGVQFPTPFDSPVPASVFTLVAASASYI